MNKTNLGIWFDFKIQPDNEWEILFERLIQAGIKECFINATVEQLEYLISLTKNYDINIHGWIWTLNRPYDKIAIKNLDWYSINRNGQNCYEFRPYVDYYQWLSPFSEGARDYIKNNILQIAKIDGIASVHLDYVRFCDVYLPENLQKYYKINQTHEFPEFDFGYHPNGRRAFKKKYGADPLKIQDKILTKKWKQFRCDAVTHLVSELKLIAKNNNTQISAAVFPYPEMSKEMVLQDWSTWKLDIICPMNYHHFYNGDIDWIADSVERGIKDKDLNDKYLSGLFLGALTPSELKEAINKSIEKGADGVSLFSNNQLTTGHIKTLKSFN